MICIGENASVIRLSLIEIERFVTGKLTSKISFHQLKYMQPLGSSLLLLCSACINIIDFCRGAGSRYRLARLMDVNAIKSRA